MALFIFDVDGTIIVPYMERPNKEFDPVELMPRRRETIRDLIDSGHTVVFVTNQGGVAFGYMQPDRVVFKLHRMLDELGFTSEEIERFGGFSGLCYICYYHPQGKPLWNGAAGCARRKPSPVMLYEAMCRHAEAADAGVMVIGDGFEDEAAARSIGIPFAWADEFFEDVKEGT